MSTLGGVHDAKANANSLDIENLAKFAVDDHNGKNQNAVPLQFVKVRQARQQVVAGTVHYITLEATVGSEKKVYEAEVWEKPWLNFKEVKGFKLAADGGSSA